MMVSSRKMSAGLIKLIRGSVALRRPLDHSRPAQSGGSRGLVPQASHWPESNSLSQPSLTVLRALGLLWGEVKSIGWCCGGLGAGKQGHLSVHYKGSGYRHCHSLYPPHTAPSLRREEAPSLLLLHKTHYFPSPSQASSLYPLHLRNVPAGPALTLAVPTA